MLSSNWRANEPATAAECRQRIADVRLRLHAKPSVPAAPVVNLFREPSERKTVPVKQWISAESVSRRIERDKTRDAIRRDNLAAVASGQLKSIASPKELENAAKMAERIEQTRQRQAAQAEINRMIANGEVESVLDLPPELHVFLTPRDRAKILMLEICEKHFLSPVEILSNRRTGPIVTARQELMYRLRMETTWSLPQIGRFLDKDHTTILHGVRAHAERNKLPAVGRFHSSDSAAMAIQMGAIDAALNAADRQVAA